MPTAPGTDPQLGKPVDEVAGGGSADRLSDLLDWVVATRSNSAWSGLALQERWA